MCNSYIISSSLNEARHIENESGKIKCWKLVKSDKAKAEIMAKSRIKYSKSCIPPGIAERNKSRPSILQRSEMQCLVKTLLSTRSARRPLLYAIKKMTRKYQLKIKENLENAKKTYRRIWSWWKISEIETMYRRRGVIACWYKPHVKKHEINENINLKENMHINKISRIYIYNSKNSSCASWGNICLTYKKYHIREEAGLL